jgi:hypothetical protein
MRLIGITSRQRHLNQPQSRTAHQMASLLESQIAQMLPRADSQLLDKATLPAAHRHATVPR